MNIRTFHENGHYYNLDTPWFHANDNVLKRIFELKSAFDTIQHSLSTLDDLHEKCEEEGTDAIDSSTDITRHIRRLMKASEEFEYCFDELARSAWFSGFTQDIAHTYWRFEEGKYRNAAKDEGVLRQLLDEVRRILDNTSTTSSQGVVRRLRRFIESYGMEVSPSSAPTRFKEDVYEARDLYCLGYYSTALLVLGRAVEKGLLELGEERKVKSIETNWGERSWQEANFRGRNNALKHVNMPETDGKVISQKQYHEISILIDYRNNVAHKDYSDIEREAAKRQIKSAYALLESIQEKIDHLQDLDDEEIEPVEGQSAS
jgi:uncharacterized protein YutE (UPF0331/DUF86 family)